MYKKKRGLRLLFSQMLFSISKKRNAHNTNDLTMY